MPYSNPLPGPLKHLPVRPLNLLFPYVRLLHQLLHLCAFTLRLPLRLLWGEGRAELPVATGRVLQVASSWRGGVPKQARSRLFLSPLGALGDLQKENWLASFGGHGGMLKAVCLFSSEVIHTLVQEGHPAAPGACGENITLQGLAWSQVAGSGAVLAIGCTAVLQMTEWTTPCESIKGAFTKGAFSRICPKRNPGCSRWYAKVVASGWVHPGDEVRVLRMPDAST